MELDSAARRDQSPPMGELEAGEMARWSWSAVERRRGRREAREYDGAVGRISRLRVDCDEETDGGHYLIRGIIDTRRWEARWKGSGVGSSTVGLAQEDDDPLDPRCCGCVA